MRVFSYVPYAYEGVLVTVEAEIHRAIPGIDISGLAAGAVREASQRVRAAFRNSGLRFPQDRVLINLAPAGVRKDGASLDLPIAASIMAACGMVPPRAASILIVGELELSGSLRPGKGVLPAVAAGLAGGIRDFIVPAQNAPEASALGEGAIFGAKNLEEALFALVFYAENSSLPPREAPLTDSAREAPDSGCGDFADVRGQARYKRALEIAAAGGHNALVFGPPGGGKTMLARRLPSIMAPLTREESVMVTRLHSLAGRLAAGDGADESPLIRWPPFRSPHHSASAEGLLGGGRSVRPGEISLAHYGVLFLDEAPEFKVNALQALREPLEDKMITISRAEGPARLPADFQLIMAANPCPCGRLGMKPRKTEDGKDGGGCFCSGHEIERYWKRFGGALLDRVELRAGISGEIEGGGPVEGGAEEERSAVIRARVCRAVEVQRERFKKGGSALRRNAGIGAAGARVYCPLTDGALRAFSKAREKLAFSGRAYYGVLRVARTIADLDGKDSIESAHILEAVQHRRLGEDPYDIFKVKE